MFDDICIFMLDFTLIRLFEKIECVVKSQSVSSVAQSCLTLCDP